MKILLLQTNITWNSPQQNRDHAAQIINNSEKADLIILPEMFTTGFATSPKDVAEKADSQTLNWMQTMASEQQAAIAGSVATEQNGKYYNRFYFVKPDGTFSTYDKHHLFAYGGEHKEYEAGQDRVIVEYMGYRIMLQICYDLRFPVFVRNTGDYDMIIYVANWPTSRIDAWNTLLRARAIENLCYVAAVNRTGRDPMCDYNGGTALINYMGQTITAAQFGKEETISGEISMDDLKRFRDKFPALKDADKFTIH